ncbi:glycosyltransferase family 4 protein, partial [Acinetobacter baumannii]
ERMTAVIANALAARGYRVLILSLWDQVCVFPLHPAVEHCALFAHRPSFKRQYASTVLGIRRFVREHGVEVLVEVDTMLTLFTLPATLGRKV